MFIKISKWVLLLVIMILLQPAAKADNSCEGLFSYPEKILVHTYQQTDYSTAELAMLYEIYPDLLHSLGVYRSEDNPQDFFMPTSAEELNKYLTAFARKNGLEPTMLARPDTPLGNSDIGNYKMYAQGRYFYAVTGENMMAHDLQHFVAFQILNSHLHTHKILMRMIEVNKMFEQLISELDKKYPTTDQLSWHFVLHLRSLLGDAFEISKYAGHALIGSKRIPRVPSNPYDAKLNYQDGGPALPEDVTRMTYVDWKNYLVTLLKNMSYGEGLLLTPANADSLLQRGLINFEKVKKSLEQGNRQGLLQTDFYSFLETRLKEIENSNTLTDEDYQLAAEEILTHMNSQFIIP